MHNKPTKLTIYRTILENVIQSNGFVARIIV